MSFESFNIKSQIVRALNNEGITAPTDIQEQTIPLIASGKDVIGISHTGSGKTAAFAIPLLDKIVRGQGIQSLIVVPTRELASQISNEFNKFGKYIDFSIATIYGGVAIGPQIRQLSRADIVVATPGRLLDHVQRKTIDLSNVETLVLDEADIMVDMGFFEDIKKILKAVPHKRQIALFGATISDEINQLKTKYMNNPAFEKSEAHVDDTLLKQYYYRVDQKEKFSLLVHLLREETSDRVIVFCPTRANVETVSKNLRSNGIKANMIHGKIKQSNRLKVIDNFNKGRPKILIASGVASRGLDIKGVSHVYNYGLSHNPEEYIHRIGRTARAGESGKAITLLSPGDNKVFKTIVKKYNVNIENLECDDFSRVQFDSRSSGSSNNKFRDNKSRNKNKESGPRSSWKKVQKPPGSSKDQKMNGNRKRRVKYRNISDDKVASKIKAAKPKRPVRNQ